MADGNPYASPSSETGLKTAARPPRPPYAWSIPLLVIGGCFLLLLNGQAFTNTLVFLGFTAVSGMIWMRYAVRSRPGPRRRLGRVVLLAHVVVLIAFASSLPGKYRRQQEFNQKMNEALQRARQLAD